MRRYAALAANVVDRGDAAAAARAAARVRAARSSVLPTSEASASGARTIVGATQPSAMRASVTRGPSNSTTTATLITEIACALRKPSLRKMPRRAAPSLRTEIERTSSPGASAVVRKPVQKSPTAIRRRPPALDEVDVGVERVEGGDRVVGRRCGDEVAGDGAARANLRRADFGARLHQRQRVAAERVRCENVVVGRERAERNAVGVFDR